MSIAAATDFPRGVRGQASAGASVGLLVLSFGLYPYAWFYAHRCLFDGELGQGRDDATLHTLGLLVPILNVFVIHWLWRDLNELRVRFGLPEFPEIAYLVGSIVLAPLFFSLVVGVLVLSATGWGGFRPQE